MKPTFLQRFEVDEAPAERLRLGLAGDAPVLDVPSSLRPHFYVPRSHAADRRRRPILADESAGAAGFLAGARVHP
jgi:hypothetical protein